MHSIRRFLYLISGGYLLIFVVAAVVFYQAARIADEALETQVFANRISENVVSLLVLVNETTLAHSERLQKQWDKKVEETIEAIRRFDNRSLLDEHSLRKLSMTLQSADQHMQELFSREHNEEITEQILLNISIRIHKVSAMTDVLRDQTSRHIQEITSKTGIVTLSIALLLLLTIAIEIGFIRAYVSRPVEIFIGALEEIRHGADSLLIPRMPVEEFRKIQRSMNETLSALRAVTVSRDELAKEVGERQKAESRALKALNDLDHAQQQMLHVEKLSAMGTFVGGVAHEMNNPLMGIMNYLDYVNKNTAEGKPKVMLERAINETERITRIVRSLLVYARSNNDAFAYCKVNDVFSRVVDVLQGKIRKADVSVSQDIPSDMPPVAISEDSLLQVLMNLVGNAVDELEGKPRREIYFKAVADETRVFIRVEDSGGGVPVDHRGRIFDPFYTTKPPGKGTGLGLSVTAQLLNGVDGWIAIDDSEILGGACFTITLIRYEPEGLEDDV